MEKTNFAIRFKSKTNALRKFGAGKEYIPVMVYFPQTGGLRPALLTTHQVTEGLMRAEANPEDAPRPGVFLRAVATVRSLFNV